MWWTLYRHSAILVRSSFGKRRRLSLGTSDLSSREISN
jgi:hypothetical protein